MNILHVQGYVRTLLDQTKGILILGAQQLSFSPAQVHLSHRVTQPVITTNTAVKGATELLPGFEYR